MQQRSLETHAEILGAAMTLFARSGYEATSVAEICEAAGVSKGAFYHHFSSKQEIFLALLKNWLGVIDAQLDYARQGTDNVPQALMRMTDMMRAVFETATGQLPMFLEFWTKASHDDAVWQTVIEPYHRYQAYFRSMIQQGIEEGSLKPVDPDMAAKAIVSLALGLLLQGLLDAQGAKWDQVTQHSFQLLLEGLGK
jgi:AcrR family transcriptional regulator